MAETALEARGICFSYGSRRVLHDVSFSVPAGAYLSLVGPNGSGKSTLLRLLCGARRCESGQVFFHGRNVAEMGVPQRARQFAVVRQQEENAFPFTCLEMAVLGLHPFRSRFGEPSDEQMRRVREIMRRTGVWELADQPVTQVSGGEFQRVVLARALIQNPRVLFLDEAMSDLDIRAKIRMAGYLRELVAQAGMTVVAVNHDLSSAYQHSDLVLALREGRLAAFGPPQAVMDEAFFDRVFGVKAEIFAGRGFFIRDHINQE